MQPDIDMSPPANVTFRLGLTHLTHELDPHDLWPWPMTLNVPALRDRSLFMTGGAPGGNPPPPTHYKFKVRPFYSVWNKKRENWKCSNALSFRILVSYHGAIVIDHEAREIMYLVASVCLSEVRRTRRNEVELLGTNITCETKNQCEISSYSAWSGSLKTPRYSLQHIVACQRDGVSNKR